MEVSLLTISLKVFLQNSGNNGIFPWEQGAKGNLTGNKGTGIPQNYPQSAVRKLLSLPMTSNLALSTFILLPTSRPLPFAKYCFERDQGKQLTILISDDQLTFNCWCGLSSSSLRRD